MCTYPPIPLSSCVHAFIDPFMVQKSTPWLRDIGGSDSLMTWTLGLKNRWYLRWSRLRFIFQVYTIHITIYIYCNYYFNYQHLIYTYTYNIVITKYFKKKLWKNYSVHVHFDDRGTAAPSWRWTSEPRRFELLKSHRGIWKSRKEKSNLLRFK